MSWRKRSMSTCATFWRVGAVLQDCVASGRDGGGWRQPGPASLEGLGLSVRNSERSQGLLAGQHQRGSFLLPAAAEEAPTFSAATSVPLA